MMVKVSYAAINEFGEDFRSAIEKGCTIEVIVADPVDNAVIKFCENCEGYRKNEKCHAEICIAKLKIIRDNIDEQKRECFVVNPTYYVWVGGNPAFFVTRVTFGIYPGAVSVTGYLKNANSTPCLDHHFLQRVFAVGDYSRD